jgi:hypothetical protein
MLPSRASSLVPVGVLTDELPVSPPPDHDVHEVRLLPEMSDEKCDWQDLAIWARTARRWSAGSSTFSYLKILTKEPSGLTI